MGGYNFFWSFKDCVSVLLVRFIIKRTLESLSLPHATVNIPVNISHVAPHKLRQPPWIVW